nr:MAG TPA: hypothetical protein [Caudoviricetes sp.]
MDNYKDNIKTTFNVAVGKSKNKGLYNDYY